MLNGNSISFLVVYKLPHTSFNYYFFPGLSRKKKLNFPLFFLGEINILREKPAEKCSTVTD